MPRFQTFQNHRRGSAVVLVIVTLVLMTLIGAVYLQTTAVQRFPVSKIEGDIDVAAQATFSQIMTILARDSTDEGDLTEWHDYPWTNPDETDPDNEWETIPFFTGPTSSTTHARGGKQDNAWLASTSPIFNSSFPNGFWEHVTNLNGYFLGENQITGSADLHSISSISATNEIIARTLSNDTQSPFNHAVDSDRLVDADGDGIPDSRWTWAATPQINGFFYAAAIRIVDLSSLANVNVWLSQVDSNNQYSPTAAHAPRWDHPSELDLGRFFNNAGLPNESFVDFLEVRIAELSHTWPTSESLVPRIFRSDFWQNQGRFLNRQNSPKSYHAYNLHDEYELRRRHGLARTPAMSRSSLIEDDLDPTLRHSTLTSNEASYIEAASSIQDFFLNEPRHQLTTLSGSAPLASRLPNDVASGPFSIKANIDSLVSDPDTTPLFNALAHVFDPGTPSSFPVPTGFPFLDDFLAQFAVNIKGYLDPSNQVHGYQTGPETYYSLSRLPMLVEVYAQRAYEMTNVTYDSALESGSLQWEERGNPGYAIEIGNPYRMPIPINDQVELFIYDPASDTSVSLGNLESLVPSSVTSLDPGQSIIFYVNSSDSYGNENIASRFGTESNPIQIPLSTFSWPTTSSTSDTTHDGLRFSIELRANVTPPPVSPSPNPVTYSRMWAFRLAETVNSTYSGPTDPTPILGTDDARAYQQFFFRGNGNGANMLTFWEGDGSYSSGDSDVVQMDVVRVDSNNLPPITYNTSHFSLGQHHKVAVGTAVNDHTSPYTLNDQVVMSGQGEFTHMGELAHITFLGFTPTQTIGERWHLLTTGISSPSLEDVRLSFDPGTATKVDDNSDKLNVPYAAALIDRFTTYAENAANGDARNIVPGLINLNTIPEHLLAQILPIANDNIRDGIANAIVKYRQNPDRGTAGPEKRSSATRQNPGIAMLGELFSGDPLLIDPAGDGSVLGFNAIATANSGGDTRVLGPNSTPIDFLGNESTTAGDGVGGDREERFQIASWLSQVGSVRSDFFVAYLYLQEFKGTNWTSGPTNARRYIAVLRRNPANGSVTVEKLLPGSTSLYIVN